MLGTQTETKVNYEVEVTRAKEFKDKNSIAFDMIVNGINIYGMWYREGIKDGKEWSMINFPSHGVDGKYYNYAWFPISRELKEDIIEKIKKVL